MVFFYIWQKHLKFVNTTKKANREKGNETGETQIQSPKNKKKSNRKKNKFDLIYLRMGNIF